MKKLLCAMAVLGATVGTAQATPHMADYWRDMSNTGDASARSYEDWARRNGLPVPPGLPERVQLSQEDAEYLRYVASLGDASALGFHEWKNPSTSVGPRKKLTKEDQEYLWFTLRYGDATPPSFYEWQTKHRR